MSNTQSRKIWIKKARETKPETHESERESGGQVGRVYSLWRATCDEEATTLGIGVRDRQRGGGILHGD